MAAPVRKLPKGLPKRTRNEKAKASRARSWLNGRKKKAERIKKQKEAEKRNKTLDETPWARSRRLRKEKRAAA